MYSKTTCWLLLSLVLLAGNVLGQTDDTPTLPPLPVVLDDDTPPLVFPSLPGPFLPPSSMFEPSQVPPANLVPPPSPVPPQSPPPTPQAAPATQGIPVVGYLPDYPMRTRPK